MVEIAERERRRTQVFAIDLAPLRRPRRSPPIDLKRRNLTEPKATQEAFRDIPIAVEAMRQFWMPTRFNRGA